VEGVGLASMAGDGALIRGGGGALVVE
jgi:hypothetical protein